MLDDVAPQTRSRTENRLSARQVETAAKPGVLQDGGGLRLRIDVKGNKSWQYRYTSPVTTKRREMGLGRADKGHVSLKEAREAAQSARALVARGLDPIEEAEREKAERHALAQKPLARTFGDYADEWLDQNETKFRSTIHRDQWRMTLKTYAAPLRPKLLPDITTEDVLTALRPIWQRIPETAKRTQNRIEQIMDAARALGLRTGENPARWRGHLDKLLPARSKASRKHHAALPYDDFPAFYERLRTSGGVADRALEFAILTAARSGEVRNMTWGEIDMQNKRWTVPAARMKASKEHRVPLSARCIEILTEMARLRESEHANAFVFPGVKKASPLSSTSLVKALAKAGGKHVTIHGFRSTFRDWAEDVARYPFGAIEAALAHTIADKTVAAYRRGDAYDMRAELMTAWANYADSAAAPPKVVMLKSA